jgi:hypothetical protein
VSCGRLIVELLHDFSKDASVRVFERQLCLIRSLAQAAGTAQLADETNALEEKSRLYALLLQLLAKSCSSS